jgi:hypothetical protein
MSPATISHVGVIHTIDKPRCIGRNPKFLCRLCKGNCLTRLIPATAVVREARSLSDSPSGSESSLVSQHSNPSLIDTTVVPMQSLSNTTLVLRGDAPFNHVISISSPVPSEQQSIPLSQSMLPPIPMEVSFEWNDLVEHQLPSSTPFQIRGILRYIVENVTSASILSSSTWKDLGFPNLVLVVCELLTFHRSPA